MNTTQFNEAQLASWTQARYLAAVINGDDNPIGGGVSPENGDPNLSGIYTEAWLEGPGNFPEPGYVDDVTGIGYFPLLLRFKSGFGGVNVALVLDGARRQAPEQVPGQPPPPPNMPDALRKLRKLEEDWATLQRG